MQKIQLVFYFIILLIGLGNSAQNALSHNAEWGARSTRDVLLSRDIVTEKFKALRVVSYDYEFKQKPPRFSHPRTITKIVVTDQYTDGDGGYATLKSGGPSTDHVVLHLKSQRGHGYNFVIDIYGQ
ncbi:probable salivary secreted peptide [Teleopsis dalmanni]|uniref:probable salivary secreted peptide n=1 Tax=Teleopsis dalmanni TaxID=139649 RepID=UPI0018CECA63|nr:probable salivary secreted peptide [Teleopsis dalmanni]